MADRPAVARRADRLDAWGHRTARRGLRRADPEISADRQPRDRCASGRDSDRARHRARLRRYRLRPLLRAPLVEPVHRLTTPRQRGPWIRRWPRSSRDRTARLVRVTSAAAWNASTRSRGRPAALESRASVPTVRQRRRAEGFELHGAASGRGAAGAPSVEGRWPPWSSGAAGDTSDVRAFLRTSVGADPDPRAGRPTAGALLDGSPVPSRRTVTTDQIRHAAGTLRLTDTAERTV